jgi:hypothetical protein
MQSKRAKAGSSSELMHSALSKRLFTAARNFRLFAKAESARLLFGCSKDETTRRIKVNWWADNLFIEKHRQACVRPARFCPRRLFASFS